MAKKTALVTGGTGFLGRNLVDELNKQGWEVSVLCRKASGHVYADMPKVRLVEGDLLNSDTIQRAISDELDCLFHVAGDTSFWRRNNERQQAVNVGGTRAVVRAARAAGVKKLVHTSTIGVYGSSFHNIDESAPHKGARSSIKYMQSKAEAEAVVREEIEAGLDATIMNPCNIVGAYDTGNWSRLFVMIEQGTLPGVPPGSGVFCHARSVVQAHISAADKGRTGENYILGGVPASQLEFVRLASKILGRKCPEKPTPAIILKTLGRLALWGSYISNKEPELTPELAEVICAHQSVQTRKAEIELGYVPASLETMIADAVGWMRQNHILATQ